MTDVHSSSQIVMEKVIKNAAYANDLPSKQIFPWPCLSAGTTQGGQAFNLQAPKVGEIQLVVEETK
jgi:hypothetical protein